MVIIRDLESIKKAEAEISNLNHELKERIKELTGLYSLGKLASDTDQIEEIFTRFLRDIVPPSMQFPDKTFGKIIFDEKEHCTCGSPKKCTLVNSLSAPIIVDNINRGEFILGYSEDLPFIPLFEQKLVDGYAERLGKIIERLESEKKVVTTRDLLHNIIDSTSDLIMSADTHGNINFWNKALALKTGFSQKDMLSRSIYDKNLPTELSLLVDLIKSTLKNGKSNLIEQEITDRSGNKSVILSNTSIISDKDNNIGGCVLIGRDITKHRKLYQKLAIGKSYFSFNESIENVFEVLKTFNEMKYSLLFVTRGDLDTLRIQLPKNTSKIILSKYKEENAVNIIDLKQILETVKTFLAKNRCSVIVLDRLDYISLTQGFKALMNFIYELNDMIRPKKCIVIVHSSKDNFDKKEISLLSQELTMFPVPEKEDIHIDEKKTDILKYISNKNTMHFSVHYTMISNEFELSRHTTKQWIDELQAKGLIRISKQGKVKHVFITDIGKEVTSNSMILEE